MPGEYTFNSGSKLLTPLSDLIGLSVDKVNFVVCIVVCVPISVWFYHYCSLKHVTRQTRLLVPPVIGVLLCWFLYGTAFKHVLILAIACYLLLRFTPVNHIHRVIFIVSTGYLSWIHWYRANHMTYYAIDISGPMMLLVQRVTVLAFNVHDGVWKMKRGEKLNDLQISEALREVPSLLEYLSYMLNYQGIFCGPLVFYVDYMNWIDEKHVYAKKKAGSDDTNGAINGIHPSPIETLPTPWRAVMSKLAQAVLFIAVVVFGEPYFPISDLTTVDQRGYLSWFWRMNVSLIITRCQYYFAWLIADAVHNACGLGFNGYDPDTGEDKWDLVSNVFVVPCEMGNSWKQLVDNWNISTLRWLRRISFDRVRPDLRIVSTFLLSAWWHGFFPAYYILFMQGALLTIASKRIRRCVRDPCINVIGQFGYNILTTIVSRFFSIYVCFPWVYIWAEVPLRIYGQMYWFGHILMIAAMTVIPAVMPPPKSVHKNGGLTHLMSATEADDSSKSVVADDANNNSTDSQSFHSKHE